MLLTIIRKRLFNILRRNDESIIISGMMNAVNELRNNNTIAHPNGQLIQAREAQLVIRLVNAVVDYIEEVEKNFSKR